MMTPHPTRWLLSRGLAIAVLAAACGTGASSTPAHTTLEQATPRPSTPAPIVATAPFSPATATAPAGATATAAPTVAQPSPATPPLLAESTPPPQSTAPPRASSVSLVIRAANLAFDKSAVRVSAGTTVTATLQNDDAGVQHNLAFGLPGLPHGETCTGPCTATQTFTASARGSYYFLCTIHDMSGTFVVE